MKQSIKFFLTMVLFLASPMLVSCGGDDDDNQNYGKDVEGQYVGELSSEGVVIDDTYVIKLNRISDNLVEMEAAFLADGSDNFNVSLDNGVYTLSTIKHSNMSVMVTRGNLRITFLNNAGTTTSFSGTRQKYKALMC